MDIVPWDLFIFPVKKGWRRSGMVMGWTAYACWGAFLFFLSSQPPQDVVGMTFPYADKLLHFIYFGIGGFLFMWALSCSLHLSASWRLGLAIFVAVAIGFIDEWHQMYTPGRHGGDFYDFAADVAGGATGILAAFLIYEWLKKRMAPGPAAPSGDSGTQPSVLPKSGTPDHRSGV